MKPILKSIALALVILFARPDGASAQVAGAPATIDYQGQVLDANGAVLAPTTPTNYTMQFRIYSAQSGGTIIWSESQIVTVDKGAFSVQLGNGVRIAAAGGGNEGTTTDLRQAFDASSRFLGLTVVIPNQTAVEITPRLAFLSSPYSLVAERAKSADTVSQTALQSATLGTTTVGNTFTLNAAGRINGTNSFEFGAGVAGKQADAGKISYGALTPGTLDIVGAGTTTADRKVKIFAEGGLTVAGNATVNGSLVYNGTLEAYGGARFWGLSGIEFGVGQSLKTADAARIVYNNGNPSSLDIHGGPGFIGVKKVRILADYGGLDVTGPTSITGALTVSGNQTITAPSSLSFGATTRQMINLWGTEYGIGVQGSTSYFRTGSNFVWFRGGSHTDNTFDSGGGKTLATLTENGFNVLVGNVGIGTSNPTLDARLVVSGGPSISGLAGAYLHYSGLGPTIVHGANTVSIKTTGTIACGGVVISTSDERIKDIIGQSEGSADLETLLAACRG